GASKAEAERFYRASCSATHHVVYGDIGPEYFVFNLPESACRTCSGLGVDKLTHPELLIPDPKRSVIGGCFVREAFKYNAETWDGEIWKRFQNPWRFSLEGRGEKLPERARNAILYGVEKKFPTVPPPEAKVKRDDGEGKGVGFQGIARRIERYYRRYRQRGEASSGVEAWLDKGMVELTCPDCNGARLRPTPLLFTSSRKNLYEIA